MPAGKIRKPQLKLIQDDPWLEPNAQDVQDRHDRYLARRRDIERDFGSLAAFAQGHHFYGFNLDEERGGWTYREWAPQAEALYLTGDFNDWDQFSFPMERNEHGVWELFLSTEQLGDRFAHGSKIKVLVKSRQGLQYRIPAYIRRAVQDEDTKNFSGQLWFPESFDWSGDSFRVKDLGDLFIYECHVGMAQEHERVGSYAEFRDLILPRVQAAGYNAIQLMAIQEHPYYGSFGYHVSSFFAPSSRFGTPEDLKSLIKRAHEMGIAVILDIVHSHTVKNTVEGINEFDGSDAQYFHGGDRGDHPQWDSKVFDYGKTEVIRFLLSNLTYWLEEFHFDGFRFDGVGSMMYYHHGLDPIDTREKYFRDGVEWDAVTYLQLANDLIDQIAPDTVTIAEDVTGMPGLTAALADGGLGFDYRLGMGIPDFWIKLLKEQRDEDWNIHEMWQVLNDRLPYVKTVTYAESHDQALVGDQTLAFRLIQDAMYWHMAKDDPHVIVDRGMALHKMIRLFTIALGGQAYMNFMGNEFGHPEWIDFPREGNDWSYLHCRRQWSLVDNPELKYAYLAAFDRDMVALIKEHRILSSLFGRQLNMDEVNKTIVFERNHLVFVFNFHHHNAIPDYQFWVPQAGHYRLILNSDDKKYGGHGRIDPSVTYKTHQKDGHPFLRVYNTNRTALVFERVGGGR